MSDSNNLDQPGFDGNSLPHYDLNLAGSAGIPRLEQLVQLELWNNQHPPEYKELDVSTLTLKNGRLEVAGFDFVPEFEPDLNLPEIKGLDTQEQEQ